MLVSSLVATAITWGIALVIVGAAVVAGVTLIRRDSRAGLPVIVVGVLAALLAINMPHVNGTAVLVVTPGDGTAVRRDFALYGSSSYRFADGSSEQLHWNSARQLVLNDTPVPMVISKVQYGGTWAEPNRTALDPYQTVKLDGRIDHFGPDDPPPETSGQWELYWLRW